MDFSTFTIKEYIYLIKAQNNQLSLFHICFTTAKSRIKTFSLIVSMLIPLFMVPLSLTTMAEQKLDQDNNEESIFEESGIPEGFELLTKPQTTMVDIYFGGSFLISTPAVYMPESITLTYPDEVIHHIPHGNRKDVLIEALSGSLDRHDNYLCREENCPVYEPDVAGVVFDESRFRLILYINRDYLPIPTQPSQQFLPPSSADGAFLQTGNLLFSGSHTSGDHSSSDNKTWTFFGQSILSYHEKYIESRWDRDKERGFSVRSLSLASDTRGLYYNAGLINSQGFGLTFSPDHPLLGIHINSSTRTIIGNGFNHSTSLSIFRTNRGRIDVLHDGRLIHTEFQEAGNQLINTHDFPSGAYEITIRIYDGATLQNEEKRLFVKTTFLPPSDTPQYFFDLGKRVDTQTTGIWPTRQNGLVTRAGYNFRVGETSSLSVAGATSGKEILTELSWLKLGKNYQLGINAMLADRGRFGYSSSLFKQWQTASISLSFRRLYSTSIYPAASLEGINKPKLLSNGFQQGSASISMPLFNGSIELRRSIYKNQHHDNHTTTRRDSISWGATLWSMGDFTIQFRSEISQNRSHGKNNLIIMGNIELNHRYNYGYNQLKYRMQTQKKKQSGLTTKEQKKQYRVATTWYDRDLLQDDLVIDAFAEKSERSSTIGTGIRFSSRYLDTSIGLNHVTTNSSSTSTYSGRLSSSMATNGESIFFGGRGSTESGLLVKLNGNIHGDFDIWVNGQRHGYTSIGNSTLINLSPFNTYTVSIRQRGEDHFEYSEAEQEFTLYPGNIQTISWNIEHILVLIGQLHDQDGNPIINALLDGVIGRSDTDSMGLFQARILSKKRVFDAILPSGLRCTVKLPEPLDIRRGVALTGPLTCQIP